MGKIVGIDLGTTNSVVAVMECSEPKVILNEEGSHILFEDGDNEPFEVETKANRLVEFPSQYRHSATPFTTPNRRILINFNFIRPNQAKDNDTFVMHGLGGQHPMT